MSEVSITNDFPNEGGWFCDECGVYFNGSLDSCPICGAFVDYQVGVARRPELGPPCCICGQPCEPWHKPPTGYGHNPDPLGNVDTDRCCDYCNYSKVVPARIRMFVERPDGSR